MAEATAWASAGADRVSLVALAAAGEEPLASWPVAGATVSARVKKLSRERKAACSRYSWLLSMLPLDAARLDSASSASGSRPSYIEK